MTKNTVKLIIEIFAISSLDDSGVGAGVVCGTAGGVGTVVVTPESAGGAGAAVVTPESAGGAGAAVVTPESAGRVGGAVVTPESAGGVGGAVVTLEVVGAGVVMIDLSLIHI